jgi:hypothetical protein
MPKVGRQIEIDDPNSMTPDSRLRFEGWCSALDSIRASLREFPDGGGDIEIMNEVERLVKQARHEGYLDGYADGSYGWRNPEAD